MTEFFKNQFNMGIIFLASAVLLVFSMRLTAPSDLMDRDQQRPVAYILDVTKNGHWICQTDWNGDITSKPPMYTWIAAIFSLMCGGVSLFSIYLPCALSTIGCILIIYYLGNRYYGWSAGLFGGLMYLLSHLGVRQIAVARTDSLFSFTVALGALIAFYTWINGRSWTPFWIVCAVATLTKGPLGVILAALGLLAALWGHKEEDTPPLKGSYFTGLFFYFVITIGWFALAYWDMGQPVYDKIIGKELLGQSILRPADPFLKRFWKPTAYFITRYSPWCFFTLFGLYRIIKKPSKDTHTKCLERFLFSWFTIGLLIFSLAKHRRPDLIIPLLVPASIIGGREFGLLIKEKGSRYILALATGILLIFSSSFSWYYHVKRPKKRPVRQTVEMHRLANMISKKNTDSIPIYYVNTPFALQYKLGTMNLHKTYEETREILRRNEPSWVVIKKTEKTANLFERLPNELHQIIAWKSSLGEEFGVFSN
jgi:4-amino-4-deoxy-L-arabinose transferase-like glycosyltransferase